LALTLFSDQIYAPNSFTPDNDGVNDVFMIKSSATEWMELTIFNRWGQIVFQTNDPNMPWDGSFSGGDYYCQDGVYQFRLKYRCLANVSTKLGFITLIR
jgi:gliding motility-associated-like protein